MPDPFDDDYGPKRGDPRPVKPIPRPCRLCGVALDFIPGPTSAPGTWIPVVKVKAVYVVAATLDGERVLEKWEGGAGQDIRISHFETCPHADQFSRSKRTKKPHS